MSFSNALILSMYDASWGDGWNDLSMSILHINEIDKVFQKGILRYIDLMIGLMYIQQSKQSEIDEVFQNGIFRYIGLMIGLMCI
jgi:hypothetical protein